METKTAAKFQRELNSLQGLTIINLVFGALTMSLAIAVIVQNITAVVQAQSLQLPQILLAVLGFVAAAISIRWLVSSAELLDGTSDIKDDYTQKKNNLDNEGITGLIVKMASYYRQNRPKIKTMMLISRIAGGCFLVMGGLSLATLVTNGAAGAQTVETLMQVLAAAINFAMATASFAIPHFFGRYSKVWDHRLEQTIKAEQELQKQLGED
ncbi:MAG: hypothetical protein NWF03_07660 [Candidatus Bathyarchaeota archaeon]|nr:hypothetical protein [Candidatus Bathyarchaeota archaeon]